MITGRPRARCSESMPLAAPILMHLSNSGFSIPRLLKSLSLFWGAFWSAARNLERRLFVAIQVVFRIGVIT